MGKTDISNRENRILNLKMFKKGLAMMRMCKDRLSNKVISARNHPFTHLFYVIETANWSTKWDGYYITKNLPIPSHTTTTFHGIQNQIVHFGAKQNYLLSKNWLKVDRSNKVVFTWFHKGEGVQAKMMVANLLEATERASVVHTSCEISKKRLLGYGVPEEKVAVVPLGVDLNLFHKVNELRKQMLRWEIDIPDGCFCIGSFQKDGAGWGEGVKPKGVKEPGVFVKVVEKLKRNCNVFVLLLGPARGYVKRELERRNIPFKHVYLKNYFDVAKYYNALDLYLITSREEGGPKAVLEAMASGIPLVSTKVGMAPEVIQDGCNGLLAGIDDVDTLTEEVMMVMNYEKSAKRIVGEGLETVKNYSWEKVGRRYYEEIYSKLVEGGNVE